MKAPEKKTRRTRRSPRGDASRAAILDTAEKHFGENGFRKASIASIAEEVGMSDPGLLHHFGSKAGLLSSLLEERFAVDEVKLQEGEELELSQLVELLGAIANENEGRRAGVKLLMVLFAESFAKDHPAHGYFKDRYKHVRAILTTHIANEQRKGTISAEIPADHVASGLIALMDGLQMQWLLDSTLDMAGAYTTMLSLLSGGLREDLTRD